MLDLFLLFPGHLGVFCFFLDLNRVADVFEDEVDRVLVGIKRRTFMV